MSTRFDKLVATGGIGIGMLFLSPVNETLGRSESRLMELSSAKDYCKQHMVLYYTAALAQHTEVLPIGLVGDDANGKNLLAQMKQERMDTRYVGVSGEKPTMLSVCIQYPDKEGGNFTASNSACELVTPEYVQKCMQDADIGPRTIVAAIPEVSVESRVEMLKIGRGKGAFCVLSVPAAEADEFLARNALKNCDLLAINEGEAQALANTQVDGEALARALMDVATRHNPDIALLVTLGGKGAYTVQKGRIEFVPVLPNLEVINTTGAGDACLGGLMAGLSLGLPLQKGANDSRFGETRLTSAAELGTLCAGMAVETEDAIAKQVNIESVRARIAKEGWENGLL